MTLQLLLDVLEFVRIDGRVLLEKNKNTKDVRKPAESQSGEESIPTPISRPAIANAKTSFSFLVCPSTYSFVDDSQVLCQLLV